MDHMGNIETLQPETLTSLGKRHLPLLEPNSCFFKARSIWSRCGSCNECVENAVVGKGRANIWKIWQQPKEAQYCKIVTQEFQRLVHVDWGNRSINLMSDLKFISLKMIMNIWYVFTVLCLIYNEKKLTIEWLHTTCHLVSIAVHLPLRNQTAESKWAVIKTPVVCSVIYSGLYDSVIWIIWDGKKPLFSSSFTNQFNGMSQGFCSLFKWWEWHKQWI